MAGTKSLRMQIVIHGNSKDAIVKLDKVQKKLRAFERQVRFMQQSLAMFSRQLMIAVGAIAAFTAALATKAVGAATIFEDAMNSLEVLIGSISQAKDLFADMLKFAATTPFVLPEVLKAGQLLMSLGVAVEDVVPKLKLFGEAAYALQKPIDQVVFAWQRLRSGLFATITMAPLGFAREEAKKWGVEFNESTQALESSGTEAVAIFEDFLGERFGGMFDKARSMLSGKIANLEDAIFYAFASVGEALTPEVKKILDSLIMLIEDFHVFLLQNPEAIVAAFQPLLDTVKSVTAYFQGWVDAMNADPEVFVRLAHQIQTITSSLITLLAVTLTLQAVVGGVQLISTVIRGVNGIRLALMKTSVMIGTLRAQWAAYAIRQEMLAASTVGFNWSLTTTQVALRGLFVSLGRLLLVMGPYLLIVAALYAGYKLYSDNLERLRKIEADRLKQLKETARVGAEVRKNITYFIKATGGAAAEEKGKGLSHTAESASKAIDGLVKRVPEVVSVMKLARDEQGLWSDSTGVLITNLNKFYKQTLVEGKKQVHDTFKAQSDDIEAYSEAVEKAYRADWFGKAWGLTFSRGDATRQPERLRNKTITQQIKLVEELRKASAKIKLIEQEQADAVIDVANAHRLKLMGYKEVVAAQQEEHDLIGKTNTRLKVAAEMWKRGAYGSDEQENRLKYAEEIAAIWEKRLKDSIALYSTLEHKENLYARRLSMSINLFKFLLDTARNKVKTTKLETGSADKQLSLKLKEVSLQHQLMAVGVNRSRQLKIELAGLEIKKALLTGVEDKESELLDIKYQQLIKTKELRREEESIALASQLADIQHASSLKMIGMSQLESMNIQLDTIDKTIAAYTVLGDKVEDIAALEKDRILLVAQQTQMIKEDAFDSKMREFDLEQRLSVIGLDGLSLAKTELDFMDDKIDLLVKEKAEETEINDLIADRTVMLAQYTNMRDQASRDRAWQEYLFEFSEELKELDHDARMSKIGVRGTKEGLELDIENDQLRRDRLSLERQKLIPKGIHDIVSQIGSGGMTETNATKRMKEITSEMDDLDRKKAEDLKKLGDLHKEFYDTMQQELMTGIQNLVQSAASGDISGAFQSFFGTMGGMVQQMMIEQQGGMAAMSLGSSVMTGLAGAGIGLLGMLVGGAFGNKNAPDYDATDVRVVNFPKWMEAFNLPDSFMFSQRGVAVNVNMMGFNPQNNREAAGALARSLEFDLRRGLQNV